MKDACHALDVDETGEMDKKQVKTLWGPYIDLLLEAIDRHVRAFACSNDTYSIGTPSRSRNF